MVQINFIGNEFTLFTSQNVNTILFTMLQLDLLILRYIIQAPPFPMGFAHECSKVAAICFFQILPLNSVKTSIFIVPGGLQNWIFHVFRALFSFVLHFK